MPARSYNSYYENGSTARKTSSYERINERSYNNKRRYGKNKMSENIKTKKSSNKALVVISIVFAFSMIMAITYRYNIISEKNLLAQKLKGDLEAAEATLLTSKIAVEQNTNIDYIEAYAKQKLGMQKPTSSQTIYVETSNLAPVVEVNKNLSVVEKVICKLKDTIKSIF